MLRGNDRLRAEGEVNKVKRQGGACEGNVEEENSRCKGPVEGGASVAKAQRAKGGCEQRR